MSLTYSLQWGCSYLFLLTVRVHVLRSSSWCSLNSRRICCRRFSRKVSSLQFWRAKNPCAKRLGSWLINRFTTGLTPSKLHTSSSGTSSAVASLRTCVSIAACRMQEKSFVSVFSPSNNSTGSLSGSLVPSGNGCPIIHVPCSTSFSRCSQVFT